MFNKTINIDGRLIGEGQPPYIVAELSANHNGDIKRAFQSIEMAKKMGADAVKIQTYTSDTLTIDCNKEDFQIKGGLWDGYTLYNLYGEAYTPYEWHASLFKKAKEVGITMFSTPFDKTAIDLLESLNTPVYKIASFELVDLALIQSVAQTGKPMIMSTGMANLEEITEAVDVARSNGCRDLILLHCVSAYPAPIEQSNVRTVPDLAERFNVIAGLSDHTLGVTTSVAAVALGASVIEKHFTLSRQDKGPDSEFSLEPSELRTLCQTSKDVWLSLGQAGYERKPAEEENLAFRRSLYVVKDIKKGELFTRENVRSIRPGFGLLPKYFSAVLGKEALSYVERGTALTWDVVKTKEGYHVTRT